MIYGIIPCKLGSTRLHDKNVQFLDGKPLVQHAIDYLRTSKLIKRIEVYITEVNDDICQVISRNSDIAFYPQPRRDDNTIYEWLTELYSEIYRVKYKERNVEVDYFVTTTPDNPIKPNNLDDHIRNAIKKKVWEHVCFDQYKNKVGALHILSKYVLERNRASGYLSYCDIKGVDIHTQEDLDKAKQLWKDLLE